MYTYTYMYVYIYTHIHLNCMSNTSCTCIGNSGEYMRPTHKKPQTFLLGYKNSSDSSGFSLYTISITVTGNLSITVCPCFILVLFTLSVTFTAFPLILLVNIYQVPKYLWKQRQIKPSPPSRNSHSSGKADT